MLHEVRGRRGPAALHSSHPRINIHRPFNWRVTRLIISAVNLPSNFHIKENNTVVDYGKVSIAGREYMLPLTATIFVRADSQKNRNEISFVRYKKFDPESVFTTVNSKITYKPATHE